MMTKESAMLKRMPYPGWLKKTKIKNENKIHDSVDSALFPC